MSVSFSLKILPCSQAESQLQQRRLVLMRSRIQADLKQAVDKLRAAKAKKDAKAVRHLETTVLPRLLLRARSLGVGLPEGMKASIKVGKVEWNGEAALCHLESLGFRRPSSKQQLRKRVYEFVRKLILDGKGALLPDELFDIPLSLLVGAS